MFLGRASFPCSRVDVGIFYLTTMRRLLCFMCHLCAKVVWVGTVYSLMLCPLYEMYCETSFVSIHLKQEVKLDELYVILICINTEIFGLVWLFRFNQKNRNSSKAKIHCSRNYKVYTHFLFLSVSFYGNYS